MALGLILIVVGVVLVIATGAVVKRAIAAGDVVANRERGASNIPQRVRRATLLMLVGLAAIIAGIVVAIVA